MDTKYQNRISIFLAYSAIILSLFFMAASFTIANEEKYSSTSYFHDSMGIRNEAVRLAKNLQRFYIYYDTFDINLAENKLDQIEVYLNDFPSIERGSTQAHTERILSLKPHELYNYNLSGMAESDINLLKAQLTDSINNYNLIQSYLNSTDFNYFVIYSDTNRLKASNSEDTNLSKYLEVVDTTDSIFSETMFNGALLSNSFKQNNLSVILAIPNENELFGSNSMLTTELSAINKKLAINQRLCQWHMPLIPICLILLIILSSIFFNRRSLVKAADYIYSLYKRLPLVIKAPALFWSFSYVLFLTSLDGQYLSERIYTFSPVLLLELAILSLVFLLFINVFIHLSGLVLGNESLKNEADIRFISDYVKSLGYATEQKEFLSVIVYLFLALALCIFYFLSLSALRRAIIFSFIMLLCTALIVYILKLFISYYKLSHYINHISREGIVEIPYHNGSFAKPLNELNNITDGLQETLENMVKSERLKSELITNVSHDLKTPLTSIISYIDLLKKSELSESELEYVSIIDQKASRLKILIEDLFEASKLSSGQLELNRSNIDIVSLLDQALGELSHKIEQSRIEFKITSPAAPLILNIDGQRMWRVFENLINNIIKYSAPDSRAYIVIEDKEKEAVLTFKNISKYQLEADTGDLFERFKRGDKARSTEGSGLGLSIAKSIIELHRGTMQLQTDGDLFKIIITLEK